MAWVPLLRREIEDGSLHSSWEGSAGLGVLCLLEPPCNALEPAAYRRAQQNSAKVYNKLQEYQAAPLPVAVQEDFWRQVKLYLLDSSKRSMPSDYIEQGGLGFVEAIAHSATRPRLVRLEDAAFLSRYKQMENAAISFMSESAELFQTLAAGYRVAEAKNYSPALREFKSLADAVKADRIPWRNFIESALGTARRLNIEPTLISHRSLLFYERLAELESDEFSEERVKQAKQELMDEIRARAEPSVIDERAAVELCVYKILERHDHDEESRSEIEQFREILAQPVLPAIPEWIRRAASELVTGARGDELMEAIRIDPDDQGKPHKGQGELISRFLELATILGIDVDKYAALKTFTYYATCHHRMTELTGYEVGHDLSARLEDLERDVLDRLATSEAEKELIALERTVKFLEELGRYHLVYDSGLRKVVLRLDVYELCEKLIRLGMTAPKNWQTRARTLDRGLAAIRDFYDRTIVRGKDLASGVVGNMKEEAAETAILACEGYLLDILAGWFRSQNVSYSAIFPKW